VSKEDLSPDVYRLINEVFLLGDDIDRQLFGHFRLTVRQYHLLNWLDVRGQAGLTELAQLLLCDKSNVTHIARRLLAANLIEKVPDEDRRFTVVRLSAAGREIHDKAKIALADSIAVRFADTPQSEHRQLLVLLGEMHARLRGYIAHLDNTNNTDKNVSDLPSSANSDTIEENA